MSKNKYYSVVVGNRPGIYNTWSDASKQVTGFKGAVHKSFKSKKEAELYFNNYFNINNDENTINDNTPINNNNYFQNQEKLLLKNITGYVAFTDGSHRKGHEGHPRPAR